MNPSKENIPRPRSNLGVRTDWRARPVSPSNGSMTDYKRSISPIPDSLSSAGSDSRQSSKYGRRPIPTSTTSSSSGAGQSVAALQQHHQWLMQQQDINAAPSSTSRNSYRSVSPAPRSAAARPMDGSSARQANKQPQYNVPASVAATNEDEDVIFDQVEDEDEGDDVEEERMVIIQDVRARSPSINRGKSVDQGVSQSTISCLWRLGSGGSIMSVQQPAPSFYHTSPAGPQEFKVNSQAG